MLPMYRMILDKKKNAFNLITHVDHMIKRYYTKLTGSD